MVNNLYMVSGTYNAYPIKAKTFKSNKKAVKYLDSLITSLDVQVEEVLTSSKVNTYIANDYSRFMITKLA